MANNRVYTESVVTLNNQEATARIDELKKKAEDLRATMVKLAQEKGINSKEFKAAQKELISTEKSMNSLNESTKKYERTINNLNGATLNQLQAALKKTKQALRNAAPDSKEYKAYSNTLKDIRARMRELEDQGRQTQKLFGGFFTKIGWAGLVTGAIATFRKLGKDMINETQRVGDTWRFETAGWKNAYESFIQSIGSGKGWRTLIADMNQAYKVGKEIAKLMDEQFEKNNALIMKEAEYGQKIEEARRNMMDASLTTTQRKEAAEALKEAETELANERVKILTEERDLNARLLEDKTKMSEEDRKFFIRGYNDNNALIEQAKAYAKALQDRKTYASAAENALKNMQAWSEKAWESAYARQDEYNQKVAECDELINNTSADVIYAYQVMQKYGESADKYVEPYVQSYIKVEKAQSELTSATARADRTINAMKKQMVQDAQNAINKAYQDDIAKSDARFKELTNQAKQAYLDGESSYEQYQQRLEDLNRQSLEERTAIAEKHKQSTIEFQTQILDLAVKDKQKLEKLMDDLQKDAQKAMEDAMAELDKEVEAFMAELDKENEEQLQKWMELCERAEEIRRENSPIYAIKEEMAEELSALEELHKNGLLSEKDYQDARVKIIAKYASKAGDIYGEYLDKASDLANALQEADSARLDAQMQAELTAAGDNAEKRQQIEEEYEKKQLDLKKKYADVDMAINIAKTVANGAVAAVKAVADLGPIAGGIMAAIIAATTVAEVAAIVAQRNAIKNASVASSGSANTQVGKRTVAEFSEGGYTERSANDYQEVGVVHANEWVAPAAMVRANPVMFASLEQMRQSGQYRSGVAGFADGGQAGANAPASVGTVDNELLQRVYDIMAKLEASLPLKAYTVLSDINAKQELENTVKSVVGK